LSKVGGPSQARPCPVHRRFGRCRHYI